MSYKRKKKRRNRRGFTLVELMVVIVIIGMLAGAVTFSVRGYLITSKQNVARMDIAKIGQALETFYIQYDRYPSNDEGIEILATNTEKFPNGILSQMPKDPWGHPYQYNYPGRNGAFEVVSLGADGREGGTGGDEDISSENLSKR
jgi:general secretion pathway protein G